MISCIWLAYAQGENKEHVTWGRPWLTCVQGESKGTRDLGRPS